MIQPELKNAVLTSMSKELEKARKELLELNKKDVSSYMGSDKSMYDRLIINDYKIEEMKKSVLKLVAEKDPTDQLLYTFAHENGMKVENRTVPFGTILIIYESRPDVTIEAAGIAFKSGNRILLKGGKEARRSNLKLTECWHNALENHGIARSYVQYLDYSRTEIQDFLRAPNVPLDLIIPRGGEKLIQFVKETATCPVLVSGRGNNFLYVSEHANLEMAKDIIINAKVSKISACNALDKVLLHNEVSQEFENEIKKSLIDANVTLIKLDSDEIWQEEFLDYKIGIERAHDIQEAIDLINKHSGGHSATIITQDMDEARRFMSDVDAAAVYHNASTRFTDGGQFGMGAEMAISTEKMHHRGPLGLDQLVTNKWYVYGDGQTR